MFKYVFARVWMLVTQPTKAWSELVENEDEHEVVLSRFIYPLIGLVSISAFMGMLFTRQEFDLESALKSTMLTFMVAMGGLFFASYMLNEICARLFERERNMNQLVRFIGYSSVLIYLLDILLMMFPEFFFFRFFVLYTFYIVWEGLPVYIGIEENRQMILTTLFTGFIVGTPIVLENVLFLFFPGLRV